MSASDILSDALQARSGVVNQNHIASTLLAGIGLIAQELEHLNNQIEAFRPDIIETVYVAVSYPCDHILVQQVPIDDLPVLYVQESNGTYSHQYSGEMCPTCEAMQRR